MTVNEHMNNMSVERKADFLAEIELNECTTPKEFLMENYINWLNSEWDFDDE
jgi:hypothetical protein